MTELTLKNKKYIRKFPESCKKLVLIENRKRNSKYWF